MGFNGKPPWPSDFYVWTHAFDVSGVASVKLFVRSNLDGVNPLSDNDDETCAGGPGVGAWMQIEMNKRAVPTGNVSKSDIQHVWVADDGASLVAPATPSNVAARATSSTQVTVVGEQRRGELSRVPGWRGRRHDGRDQFSDSGLTPLTS